MYVYIYIYIYIYIYSVPLEGAANLPGAGPLFLQIELSKTGRAPWSRTLETFIKNICFAPVT